MEIVFSYLYIVIFAWYNFFCFLVYDTIFPIFRDNHYLIAPFFEGVIIFSRNYDLHVLIAQTIAIFCRDIEQSVFTQFNGIITSNEIQLAFRTCSGFISLVKHQYFINFVNFLLESHQEVHTVAVTNKLIIILKLSHRIYKHK